MGFPRQFWNAFFKHLLKQLLGGVMLSAYWVNMHGRALYPYWKSITVITVSVTAAQTYILLSLSF